MQEQSIKIQTETKKDQEGDEPVPSGMMLEHTEKLEGLVHFKLPQS
jgi:hypothetical protein